MKKLAALLFTVFAWHSWPIETVPIGCTTDPCVSQPPPQPTGVTGYFVDCTNGNDSSTTPTNANTPWRTLSKVNTTVTATGADVWIKAGSVCEDQTLTIDWSGTAGDRVEVGSYYLSGGVVYQSLPDNPTAKPAEFVYSNGRAEINGTFTTTTYPSQSACNAGSASVVSNAGCSFNSGGSPVPSLGNVATTYSGLVPANMYSALVTVNGHYVTVQDLKLKDSAGFTVSIPRIGVASAGYTNTIIRRVQSERYVQGMLILQNAQLFTITSNLNLEGGLREYGEGAMSNPADMSIRRDGSTSLNMPGLVENNDMFRMHGEGVNYIAPYLIVRNNRIGNMGARPCIYAHNGHTVIENNICFGGNVDGSAAVAGAGIKIFVEDFDRAIHLPNATLMTEFVVRNNMVSGTSVGIAIGAEPLSIADGLKYSGIVYGNTIVDSTLALDVHWLTSNNFAAAGIAVRDNIFYASTTQCSAPASGSLTRDHNLWGASPVAGCQGSGDVTGNPLLTGTGFTTKIYTAPPIVADYYPQATSPALAAGVLLTSSVADLANYTAASLVTSPCSIFDLTEATRDALCEARSGLVAIGAQEREASGLILAQGYFVDCANGNDASTTPTNPATPWRTASKVNSTVTVDGSDVWFKAGTTCTGTLYADWDGDASNRATIGTYYLQSGVAYQLLPDNPTAYPQDYTWSKGTPAVIRGSYDETCSPILALAPGTGTVGQGTPTCLVQTAGAIPSNIYSAGVMLACSYCDVQSMKVAYHASTGIQAGSGSYYDIGQSNHRILYNHVYGSASTGLYLRTTRNDYVYGNLVQRTNVGGNKGDQLLSDHGCGIFVGFTSQEANGAWLNLQTVVENNDVIMNYGEGFILHKVGGLIIRANRTGNNTDVPMYSGECQDCVIENNIIWGGLGPYNDTTPAEGGIMIFQEQSPGYLHIDLQDVIVRGNMVANATWGIGIGAELALWTQQPGWRLDNIKMYNNTFANVTSGIVFDTTRFPSANISGIEFKNNIIMRESGTQLCSAIAYADNILDMDYNVWSTQPADTDCRGANDVNAAPLLTGSGWSTKGIVSGTEPTLEDFMPQSSSPVLAVGVALSTTIIDSANYAEELVTFPCSTFDLVGYATDPNCRAVDTARDIGAIGRPDTPVAVGRFVDCSAGSNGTGLTAASPWNSITSANNATIPTSTDLWLKDGTTCNDEALLVDWAGTALDRVVVGTYHLVGGVAYQGPTDEGNLTPYGTQSAGSRARIRGTYRSTCRPNCAYDTGAAVPSNPNAFLAGVSTSAVYVTIQDLWISDSAGQGLGADTSGTFSSPTDLQLILQDNYVDHTAATGIAVLDSSNTIIRRNVVAFTNLNYADFTAVTDWGNGILCSRSIAANCLIEGNFVHDTVGEGIGPYRSRFVVIRGNYVADTRRAAIYPAGANDIVVEQNMIAAGPFDTEGFCSPVALLPRCSHMTDGWFPSALDATIEETTQHSVNSQAGLRRLFRNNISVNSQGGCLTWGIHPTNLGTWYISGKSIGNTCYMLTDEPGPELGATNVGLIEPTEQIEIANNLFVGGAAGTNCTWPSGYTSVTTLRYNGSQFAWSDSDCVGTGDVISTTTGVAGTFPSASSSNFPVWSELKPASNTAFKDNGIAMTTSAYLTVANYPMVSWFEWEPPCGPGGQLSSTDWARPLFADYCGTTRGASPDLGAIEQASN